MREAIIRKPENTRAWPHWNGGMDPYFEMDGWTFHEKWLEPINRYRGPARTETLLR